MRKLLTVSLLGVLMSIPLVVFAQASLYGSIRTGIESNNSNKTGVIDFISRWGFQGSSEVSEGLTAVYRYERRLNSSDASEPRGRLSYVGLSGSFGTVTIGKALGAPHNHFGGIVDQSLYYGRPIRTGYRLSNLVSYSVSVGNVSLQVDAIMDQSTGKTGDAFNFGATLGGLMETGSITIAHRKRPDEVGGRVSPVVYKASSSYVAGNYGIGDTTVFLGYSKDLWSNSGCSNDTCIASTKTKTTYAGVHGEVGDNGVNYVFTMSNEKYSGANRLSITSSSSEKTPWTFGLSKSLGGGASVKFEYLQPDTGNRTPFSSVWLQVDF